jgi:hypothetical protein
MADTVCCSGEQDEEEGEGAGECDEANPPYEDE